MGRMAVFLGLDCGGSTCRAMAVDEDGTVAFQGHAGAANILSTPQPILRRNLFQATSGCPEPDVVCGCFAGLVNSEEAERAERMLSELFPTSRVRALPDYCAAFMACPAGTHACVIAGTGSVVCSRTPEGWVKSGARGYLLGNEGSAFRYGQAALLHYLDHPDEADPATLALIEKTFESTREPQVVARLYRSPSPAALLARIAPICGRDAHSGKPYAVETLKQQTSALASQVRSHLSRHFSDVSDPLIAVAGGVWSLHPIFLESFQSALRDAIGPGLRIEKIRQAPVHGAVLLAREAA